MSVPLRSRPLQDCLTTDPIGFINKDKNRLFISNQAVYISLLIIQQYPPLLPVLFYYNFQTILKILRVTPVRQQRTSQSSKYNQQYFRGCCKTNVFPCRGCLPGHPGRRIIRGIGTPKTASTTFCNSPFICRQFIPQTDLSSLPASKR